MKEPYFSHDQNARTDPKIAKIRVKYGMEGYGCFFALLEMLSAENEHALEYSDDLFDAVAYELRLSFDVHTFIDRCLEIGLFASDQKMFWSDSFNRRLEEVSKKSAAREAAASKAAAARWSKTKAMPRKYEGNANALPSQSDSKEGCSFSLDSIDPEWLRVVTFYEQNIGLMPTGVALDALVSYFDDLGTDVMIEAIKTTNLSHPDYPAKFLCSILKKWVEKHINTVDKAKAEIADHDRKTQMRNKRGDDTEPTQAIRGKFY